MLSVLSWLSRLYSQGSGSGKGLKPTILLLLSVNLNCLKRISASTRSPIYRIIKLLLNGIRLYILYDYLGITRMTYNNKTFRNDLARKRCPIYA